MCRFGAVLPPPGRWPRALWAQLAIRGVKHSWSLGDERTGPSEIGDTLEVPLGKQRLDNEICKLIRTDAGCIDL